MHPSVNQLLLAFLGAAHELIQWALKALPGRFPHSRLGDASLSRPQAPRPAP